jgi:hypothetical protein
VWDTKRLSKDAHDGHGVVKILASTTKEERGSDE